jgi:hypothetical protein
MDIEQAYKSEKCRKTAQNLLTSVSRLVNQAAKTADNVERRELYLQAMSMSNEAYDLLGKARKIYGKTRSDKKICRNARENLSSAGEKNL